MKEFRPLTSEEINVLESHGCWAEDWSSVMVDEEFRPNYLSRVLFYGENRLGVFERINKVGGQFPNESHRIGQQKGKIFNHHLAYRGV